ncbi:uncharacterized protein TrAtP1_003010 [Trichoderma atroviride]|uniref:uncharacterized protein n=1 Tax=Hypocrea atroviridis TaxID=63577 RepID=UPI003319ED6E|nr:hypothetical protein TrAtP1_003010 [Trichoderma atroviride]
MAVYCLGLFVFLAVLSLVAAEALPPNSIPAIAYVVPFWTVRTITQSISTRAFSLVVAASSMATLIIVIVTDSTPGNSSIYAATTKQLSYYATVGPTSSNHIK